MKYAFIHQHAQEYPVTSQCQVLAVAESGDSAWRQGQLSERQQADGQLWGEIQVIYQQNRGL